MTRLQRTARFGLLITAASAAAAAAFAAAPPAGTRIGNQAAATYTNVAGDQVTVTSNKVETIVQQVSGVDLETDLTEDASPGGKVFLPHTITNIGNGSDTFTLAATDADAGGNPYDFTSIRIFADADLDGVADSATPITVTPTLAPGDTFGIVIEALVPSSATPGAAEDITVTATSDFDGTTVDTNTDTITVSSGAITELQKSMTVVDTNADGLVSPGDRVDITITYSSTGLADAQNVVITDVLDAALTYDAGSATWSDSAVALTDAADAEANTNGAGDVASFAYDGTDTVDFTIDNIPAGRTGSFSFSATISANTPAGDIDNIATQTVDGVQAPPSNVPTITVDSVYRVSIADYEAGTYKVDPDDATNLITTGAVSAVDDDTTRNDIVEESTDVAQGSTIPFDFVITNHSNEDQTIAVSYANVDFPAGTSFQLLGSDGATPLVGPIGPLAPGETASVTLAAKLPADLGATAVTDYTATIIAQPVDGGDANSSTAEFSGAITGASVDLTNSAADGDGGDGPNATDGGAPWHEKAVDPDVTAVYTMEIENQGPTADSYDLSIAGLPAGYVATFTLADGTPITNTGSIPSGGVQTVLVNVIVPEDATPSSDDFSVTLLSPATGQGDTLTNRITVNEVVDVVIEHDQTGQAAAGGVLDIPHTLRNEGNTTITEGAITLAGDFANFSGTLFWDVNGDQIADSGDVVIDNIDDIVGGLAPGAEASLILRAQVPSTTSVGLTESETINVATSLNAASKVDSDASNNSVTDTVTVVSGDLTLVKRQAIDTACNGGAGGYSLTAVNAEPGQCIAYRIQAENTGTANATDVVITDSSPAWTTFTECGATCNATMTGGTTATLTKPAEGAAGQVRGEFGTLLPGQSAILDFTVQISN